MFILWYSASSTFGKDSDIVMGVRRCAPSAGRPPGAATYSAGNAAKSCKEEA